MGVVMPIPDFDKNHGLAMAGNQVYFSATALIVAQQNGQALPGQITGGKPFPGLTELSSISMCQFQLRASLRNSLSRDRVTDCLCPCFRGVNQRFSSSSPSSSKFASPSTNIAVSGTLPIIPPAFMDNQPVAPLKLINSPLAS